MFSKTKGSIILSILFFLFAALIASGFWQVLNKNRENQIRESKQTKPQAENISNGINYTINSVEVDSCEYIVARTFRAISVTHKSNCKNH